LHLLVEELKPEREKRNFYFVYLIFDALHKPLKTHGRNVNERNEGKPSHREKDDHSSASYVSLVAQTR
jgi:hypothetical protein